MTEIKMPARKRKTTKLPEGTPLKSSRRSTIKQTGAVTIDYPQNGEEILPEHYSIRVTATHHPAELSIDDGEWQVCREAGGYYWYDWHWIPLGKHKCAARIKLENGKYKKSKATIFKAVQAP